MDRCLWIGVFKLCLGMMIWPVCSIPLTIRGNKSYIAEIVGSDILLRLLDNTSTRLLVPALRVYKYVCLHLVARNDHDV